MTCKDIGKRCGATVLAGLGALGLCAFAPAPPKGSSPAPVRFRLLSPQNGATLLGGERVLLRIRVGANATDNQGLALALVDLVQDPANPQQVSLPAGRRDAGMAGFDWPDGYVNPRRSFSTSGFGGTPMRNALGGFDLIQMGGAQNTFGQVGPCLGPDQDICIGQDVVVDPGVGHGPNGQLLGVVRFNAPTTPGTYSFHIENAVANTLIEINRPPAASAVRNAQVQVNASTVTFVVQ